MDLYYNLQRRNRGGIVIFTVLLVTVIILVLTLIDLPFLLDYKKKSIVLTYYTLICIGISIYWIIFLELPVPSPAVVIEKIIYPFIGR